jgi:predicted transcriptional regulator
LQSEERLETYQEKLEKIKNLKDELKSHIAALPDIPQVPSVCFMFYYYSRFYSALEMCCMHFSKRICIGKLCNNDW